VKESVQVKMVKYYEVEDQNLRLVYTYLSIPQITNILNMTDVKNYDSRIIFVECIRTIRSSNDISNFTKSIFFTLRQSQSLTNYYINYFSSSFCGCQPKVE